MVFNLFKKTDPICGMKQEKGKGFVDEKTRNWFCSENCRQEFYDKVKCQEKKKHSHKGNCCH